jgi:riboflavin synthase
MFTGIIEELGKVTKIQRQNNVLRLKIEAEKIIEGLKIGDSVSVNGVCLTLISQEKRFIEFDVMHETASNTTLGYLRIGELVNLERSLKVGDRISGHFVNGHVDCIGVIRNKSYSAGNPYFDIAFPKEFLNNVVEKGSIAVDGISLTVAKIRENLLTVNIIPHTLENTNLKFKGPSSKVNLEFDILLKRKDMP